MANSKTVSLRIPSELLSKLDQLAEEKYSSHKGVPNRSLVILDAIAAYCDTLSDNTKEEDGIASSHTVTIEQFQSLQEIVYSLAEELNNLRQKSIAVQDNVIVDDSMGKESEEEEIESADKSEKIPIQLPIHQTEVTIFDLEHLQGKPSDTPKINTPDIEAGDPPARIIPIKGRMLVKRLILPETGKNVSPPQLSVANQKTPEDFCQWTMGLDIDNIGWEYKGRKIGYAPAGELSSEQKSNLLNWIQENS